jgi:hypothetical protein
MPGRPVPDNYGDVLPPVRYAPSGAGLPPPGTPGRGQNAQARAGAGRSPAGSLLVAATVAVAVAVSVVLPVAGTVISLLALVALRAGHQTVGQLSRRRSRRGARPSDTLLAAVTFPPALAWSALRSVLIAPAALVAAGVVAVITIIAAPDNVPLACAYAAGMLVLFYGFGPGSEASRKPIRGFFDTVADTPITAATAVIAVGAVLIMAIVVAASHSPFFWPDTQLGAWIAHWTSVQTLVHDVREQVLRLIGRPG